MKNSQATVLALATFALAACSSGTSSSSGSQTPTPTGGSVMSASASSPDPRVGLRPGTLDSSGTRVVTPAAEASWNLRLVSATPPPAKFMGSTNSDLAFTGNYAILGN